MFARLTRTTGQKVQIICQNVLFFDAVNLEGGATGTCIVFIGGSSLIVTESNQTVRNRFNSVSGNGKAAATEATAD